MASNRLYLVDKGTKTYLCIAKSFGDGWSVGNLDLYQKFLSEIVEYGETDLLTGTEEDDEFYNEHIVNGINYNEENKWESPLI